MSNEPWDRIEELFSRGLQASDAERHALLADCDDLVARRVRALWQASESAGAFLQHGIAPEAVARCRHACGDLISERFTLLQFLGAGGMSEVFSARDETLGRQVALKFLNAELAGRSGQLQREARAVCALSHPNICTVHDLGWQDGAPFLVMECLVGETLADRLRRGPMDFADIRQAALQLTDGLAEAHHARIVHRDVKPSNIMLTPRGVKLFDFGIAKLVPGVPALANSATFSTNRTIAGSAAYMSPEQADGRDVDSRSDIFSLGAVLYEMVTGTKAFDRPSSISTIGAIVLSEPPPIASIRPDTPADIEHAIGMCLKKDVTERFQTVDALRGALTGVSASAAPARIVASSGALVVCAVVAASYGTMVGLALLVEVAYRWSDYASWAVPGAVVTGVCSFVAALFTFTFLRKRVDSGRLNALGLSALFLILSSIAVAVVPASRLPNETIVQATFQPMTGQVGYAKSMLEALALPFLSLVPIHVVFVLRHELRNGHHALIRRMLTRNRSATVLRGTIVPSPVSASVIHATVCIWWISANAHLLESLKPAPYFGLFLVLAILRASVGLLTLQGVLFWYIWTLNEIKREAVSLTRSAMSTNG
jgi:hypothetical protein